MNSNVFEKVFTRDAPLVIIEVWNNSFNFLSDRFGIEWPEQIFILNRGAIETWRPTIKFYIELPQKMSEWAKIEKNTVELLHSFEIYTTVSTQIKNWKVTLKDSTEAMKEINHILELFHNGLQGLIPAFWFIEWNDKAQQQGNELFSQIVINESKKLRSQDSLFDDVTSLIYSYLEFIVHNEKLNLSLLKILLHEELNKVIINKIIPDKEILNYRGNSCAYFEHKFYSKEKFQELLKEKDYLLKKENQLNLSELKGISANKGLVRGKVVVVMNREQLTKVQEGDILVAPMTTPFYEPVMRKASAFVTDEGGIMCHAAIIAREMKKPCIVGTKIATQVLKDGDMVEVNADKGIVRKKKNET